MSRIHDFRKNKTRHNLSEERCCSFKFNSTATLGVVMLMLILQVACTTGQLPPGAELSIAPDNRTFNVVDRRDEQGRCLINPDLYVDEPIIITLLNAQGSPVGNKLVSVYADYAGNSFAGPQVLALYDDHLGNGNGVIDGDMELISGIDDDVARVRTDELTGARVLLLRINVSCPFRGDIVAFVDGVVAIADISVNVITESES